jgi:hypothetical protein
MVFHREGGGAGGMLAPRVARQLALASFGRGFTPPALEGAFLLWSNALHADIDGVAVLVLAVLLLLTLAKGSAPDGASGVGGGATLLRLLRAAAPGAAGLHWAIAFAVAAAIAHAALLTSPHFVSWWVAGACSPAVPAPASAAWASCGVAAVLPPFL